MSRTYTPEENSIAVAKAPALSPDLYREIFVHSNEPIAIIDTSGRYIEQNAAHRELLGYSDEELKNETPAIHLGAEAFETIAAELSTKGEYRGEATSTRKDGEVREIELSAFTTRDESGEPIFYVGIKRDVTERKRAEENIASHRDRVNRLLRERHNRFALGWSGWNGLARQSGGTDLLGYSREEYVGHHIAEFHVDRKVIDDILARLKAGELLRDYEARMRCKDNSIKHVRINSSVFWDEGKFVHTRCFTRDITDRKRTERRLALQYDVTRILAESTDFIESAQAILQVACEHLDWDVGALWMVDRENDVIRCLDFCKKPGISVDEFEELTRAHLIFQRCRITGTNLGHRRAGANQ